jgi:hypothetical protein
MPVIRLAGSGGGFFQQAGQAAGTFDKATADSRRQQYSRERIAQQRYDAELKRGQDAQQQDIRNQQVDRQIDLRETDSQNRRKAQMRTDTARGIPASGISTKSMLDRALGLAPGLAESKQAELMGLLGGRVDWDSPDAASQLEALPNFPEVQGFAARLLPQAQEFADRDYFTKNAPKMARDMAALDPEWAKSQEGIEWDAENSQLISEAMQQDDLPDSTASREFFNARRKIATQAISLRRRRIGNAADLDEEWEKIKIDDMDPEVRDEILGLQADMMSSDEPDKEWAKAIVLLNPKIRLAAAYAEKEALSNHSVGMYAGVLSSVKPDGLGGAQGDPGLIDPKQNPGVAKMFSAKEAKGEQSPREEAEASWLTYLDNSGIDSSDDDQLAGAIEKYRASKAKREAAPAARKEAAIDKTIYGDQDSEATDQKRFRKMAKLNGFDPDDPEDVEEFRPTFEAFKKRRRNSVAESIK